ncbi:MAG: hypothetical protein LQ338_004573 [Usnochroma carphineum]|nr:MAG: hypothetical protein LQ338_004573 [Usnochroma carphineum]
MASSVGDEINLATKSDHTTLNQLILQFLPFALPPNTPSHHLYALGISQFYPIYAALETSFGNHLCSNALSPRTAAILEKLHLPELERAQALMDDLEFLLPPSRRDPDAHSVPRLEAFRRHINASLAQKPHLLFAYTWIFYMALFSGGRYIRAKLRAGLGASISSVASPTPLKPAGLTFWDFPGEHDGEDLKSEYKSRVSALSAQLTEEERADIVGEGVQIMVFLTDLVKEVAEIVPSQAIALAMEARADGMDTGFQGPVARIRPPWLLLVRSLFLSVSWSLCLRPWGLWLPGRRSKGL